MSSKKPSSDPLEPEGTGVPADDAAEHTTSGSPSTDSAATADSTGSGEPADKAAGESADPDATVKVDKSADPDATAKVDPPDSEPTVALGKSTAGISGEPGSENTVQSAQQSGAGEPETGAEEKKSSGRFPLPVLAGAAVLVIGALVAVGVFFYLANDRQSELDRRAAATKAACDFGNSFATYTGDEADDYVSRLDRTATGDWKKLVSQIGPDLKARFAETQVNSTASEVQCGYESGDGDKARVVLVIDQQFTTVGGPQEQGPGRVKVAANVDMEKVEGRWLVADFDTPMMQQ
ncbi:hypothetical protein HGA13_25140 [Nocardia speluncae]|uniref:Mce-associated membrane protein n=1 Tax=Nocardia speluncae TaxID=419477 RepID=A0A846XL80_9NOCA|nr:hypothetical protein [Nocardia speluncae]NKY36327.1 hypothetical protein [Nocardia speluncae]